MVRLVCKGVSKTINHISVLSDINMTLESGYIYGLQGKNGSGKTMLMRVISGLVLPTSGSVIINGIEINRAKSFAMDAGIMLETPSFLPGYSAFRNLKLLAGIKNIIKDDQIIDILSEIGLDPFSRQKYRTFSLGMKQKLGIACALMEDAELLLLDEPFNALDESSRDRLRMVLDKKRKDNKLIVLSSHDKDELEQLTDVIYTMQDGRIVEEK